MDLADRTQSLTDTRHPSLDLLQGFALGELDDDTSEEIEQHLSSCVSCRELLRAGAEDSLIALLRAAGATPIDSALAPRSSAARRQQSLPGYELLEVVGEGGMGVVWKARQIRLNRLVALKLLRSPGTASPEALARFRREAEAVARLRHPHIVQIHEIGEQDGEPYLVLEYVGGGSLAQKLTAGPLPPSQAAELVETLARAMHHAHQHGVIHRDLKPNNVLLDEIGSPKIGDFGLAKQLDEATTHTQTGAILGTPSYMAPEQASSEKMSVGPSADVYALGAVLYETLTGRPPFRGPTMLDTLAQVREREPVPPRQLQPSVPRDLQTICLKCLHKDPRRRYGSALELAEDLRRFLAGEPIRARPVGFRERTWKWIFRRPGVAALAACTFAAAVTLVVGGLIYQFRLTNALGRAESNSRKMIQAWGSLIDLARHNRLDVDEEDLLRVLKTPREAYEELLRENRDDPAIRHTSAILCHHMCACELGLGRLDQAKADCQQALVLAQQLVADFPDEVEYRRLRAHLVFAQANVHAAVSQHAEAVAAAQQARSHFKELPLDQRQDRIYFAWLCLTLGGWTEDREKAEELYHEALALVEDDIRGNPPAPGAALVGSGIYLNLGNLYLKQGRASEAEAAYQKALALAKVVGTGYRADLYAPMGNNPQFHLAQAYHNLAALRWKEPKQAEELYLQALRLREEVAERHPHNIHFMEDLVLNHENLTAFYCSINRFSSAEEHLREAMKIRLQLASTARPMPHSRLGLAREYGVLAEIRARAERCLEAEDECRKGLELAEPVARDRPHDRFAATVFAEVLAILGLIQIQNQKPREGIATLTRTIPLLEELLRKAPDDAYVRGRLRECYGARATALKARGELFKAGKDWLRSRLLEHPPHS